MTTYSKFNGDSAFKPNPKPEPKDKKKPSKIKPVSDKRAKDNKIYLTLREVFLKDRFCPITGEAAIEVHHTYSGKDRDAHFLDMKTWMAVSRDGHLWIHANPKESRELGYLK